MASSDPFFDHSPAMQHLHGGSQGKQFDFKYDHSRYFQESSMKTHTSNVDPITPSQNDSLDLGFSDQDEPLLDEFDRNLLAEQYQSRQWRAENGTARLSISSRPTSDSRDEMKREQFRALPDHQISNSSRCDPFSSPTVSVAQKRHQFGSFPNHFTRTDVLAKESNENYERGGGSENLRVKVPEQAAPTPTIQGIRLVAVSNLPDQQRALFKFPLFNAVQSKCFPCVYNSDDNLVVSAPTGSGKTVLMELAICRLMDTLKAGDIKIVYQAPTKSLCNERYRDWQSKFGTLGVQCAELTGDTEFNSLRNVASASIIITTPEKWDSVTRKWKDNARLMKMIKLFLIDEVHILKDTRGATLEAIVSRMKSVGSEIRFLAMSATIPNSNDIAAWLTRSSDRPNSSAQCEVFGETFRPVSLETHIKAYQGSLNPWGFDKMLTDRIPDVVARYSRRKPVMIFCCTKDSASKTANTLASAWNNSNAQFRAWNAPSTVVVVEDENLQKVVSTGVAFHHGGLSASDRHNIERGFLDGSLNIICSTSTLAVGVNLPCYLVILKGTVGYTETGLKEYSCQEVIQMLGRAGRPQYETEACAIIMCNVGVQKKYESLVSGQELLESSLHLNLIEHLNAEIGIGTVHDMPSAQRWLAGTFLAVRLTQNPSYYKLSETTNAVNHDDILMKLCEKDLNLLQSSNLVQQSLQLKCTEYGIAMAQYYIRYETMKIFMTLPAKAKTSDILNTLCQAEEFRELRPRGYEKPFLKDINKRNDVRHPLKADITLPAHKVSLLIQAKLGCVAFEKSAGTKGSLNGSQVRQLLVDTNTIIGHSKRLIRCLIDLQVQRSDSISTRNALELGRSFASGVWDNSPLQMKQVDGIGEVYARKLGAAGIKSMDALYHTEANRIEVLLSKNPPFGSNLMKKVAEFPVLHVSVKEMGRKPKKQGGVELKLRSEIGFVNEKVPLRFNGRYYNILFLAESSIGEVIDFRRFHPTKIQNGEEILLTACLSQPISHINCHVMCDDISGTHRDAELQLNVPITWFPEQKPLNKQNTEPSVSKHTESEKQLFDDFGADGLEDSDLLAVAEGPKIEVIQDIDEIMREHEAYRGDFDNRKRRGAEERLTIEEKNETTDKNPPISQQLANGRWTCQHQCNAKGITCKHKCCKEGVERPRKRPKKLDSATISAKEEDDTMGFMDGKIPFDSHISGLGQKQLKIKGSHRSDSRECNISQDEHNRASKPAVGHHNLNSSESKSNSPIFQELVRKDSSTQFFRSDNSANGIRLSESLIFENKDNENFDSEDDMDWKALETLVFENGNANLVEKATGSDHTCHRLGNTAGHPLRQCSVYNAHSLPQLSMGTSSVTSGSDEVSQLCSSSLSGMLLEQIKHRDAENERRKEIHVEEQQRKWAEIESDWLNFEEYGDLVELV